MGNWYYMRRWVNVWNFRRKKLFFFNFGNFFSYKNDLSVIFGFFSPINKGTNFHENSANQTRNMDENVLPQIPKMATKRTKERDCGPIFWSQYFRRDRCLKLVLLLILTVCIYAPNFIEIWKGGFQACPTLMWNFPFIKCWT